MHNQKRSEYKARFLDPKVSAGLEAKALKWNAASSELLVRRGRVEAPMQPQPPPPPPPSFKSSTEVGDKEKLKAGSSGESKEKKPGGTDVLLAMTAKLLSVNPDPSHLWNHRRELLLAKCGGGGGGDGGSSSKDSAKVNKEEGSEGAMASALFDAGGELSLTASCLEKNPKAYGAWFHRKWAVRRSLLVSPSAVDGDDGGCGCGGAEKLLRRELDLCAHFLTLDERNFHCWNYRRYVVSALAAALSVGAASSSEVAHEMADGSWDFWIGDLALGEAADEGARVGRPFHDASAWVVMGPQLTRRHPSDQPRDRPAHLLPSPSVSDRDALLLSEFDFTRTKVESNFSNGSAFHYRSKLLPLVLESRLRKGDGRASERYELTLDTAREELGLIRNATYTEPDDQTSWWYHRFVVSWAATPPPSSAAGDKRREGKEEDDEDAEENAASYMELLEDEVQSLRELIDAEGGRCKWGLLALHMVLVSLLRTSGLIESLAEEEERKEWEEEADGCLVKLMELDADRTARYRSMRRRRETEEEKGA